MEQNQFAAQFTQSRKNKANYMKQTTVDEGYTVTMTVRTRKAQAIALPASIDVTALDVADQKIIQEKVIRVIA